MNQTQHPFSMVKHWKFLLGFAILLLPLFAKSQLTVSFNTISPSCNGWTNGTVTTNVSGGIQPYTYAWSNGYSGSSLVGVGAGTYSVTVTDANGDNTSGTVTLSEPASLVVSIAISDVCSGNGNASANATGGTGPYSFAWDNGSSGSSVSGLSPGLHCVTVTDANGCQDVDCVSVAAGMSLNLVVQGLACFNFCDASVEAVVTGGTGPLSYSWSNGANGSVNENLGPGDYSVTVTDANGCTVSGTATVGNPIAININVIVTNPPCGSSGTGSAVANVTGGTAPYSYLWSTGATGSNVSGLAPGNYSLTVTDFLGCTESTAFTVIQESDVNITIQATPSSGCGAPDGSATAVITGGTAPYTILWSNGATTETATGLAPGNYSVIVTDVNGCGATAQVTIGGTSGIDLMITGVNAGCAANGSASAMVTPGTGTPPFTYLWNTGETTSIINNLSAGTYSVTVTDAAGCTAADQVTVTGTANIDVSTTGTNVTCYGGSNGAASATASGGTGPYTYSWSNGASGATVTGLAAGTYFVTATDLTSGCTAMTNVFISQPTELTANASGTDAGCNNNSGTASASASGGTTPYTFAWSNGASGANISGLASGTYTVTATDANGCTATATATVAQGTDGPSVSITINHPVTAAGNDGALTATVNGGTTPYTFAWNIGATTASISGLSTGTYTVTVTDANGCTDDASVNLYVPACIGDRIWNDVDRDGCQDPGEFGFANVKLTLTGTDIFGNAVSLMKTTALNGQYLFDNLVPGNYQVQMAIPAEYALSPANACSNDFNDSDFNASGNSGTITLASGQCNITIDGGLYDVCLNIIDPGTICCNQTLCGPGNDPAPITSVTPATGGGSATQYMWMYSTVPGPFDPAYWLPIPTATGPSYDPGILYETTYFIRCAKAANCEDWLESNAVTITVDDVAVAEITGPDLVCVGDVVTYTALNNGPGATYSWNFGPWSTPSTATGQSVTVKWNSAGVVYVTLTVKANGCTSNNVLGVAISNSPIICGSPLIINVNNVNNAVMVEWEMEKMTGNYKFAIQRSADGVEFSNLAIMEQTADDGVQRYAYADYFPKAGNAFYRLEILHNNKHLMYSNIERITRFSEKEHFIVYPNPVSDFMMVESSDKVKTAVQMEVFSLEGKLAQTVKLSEGTMTHPVDFSQLRSGSYFVRFTFNDGQQEVFKFVKE